MTLKKTISIPRGSFFLFTPRPRFVTHLKKRASDFAADGLRLDPPLRGLQSPVRVINPIHEWRFARPTGRLAKTDPIDAEVLAHYAEARKMATVLSRRRQLIQVKKFALAEAST
jgi:transposase